MNSDQIIKKLYEMKFIGMARSYEEKINKPGHRDLSFEEFLALLVNDEYLYRKNQRQTRLLQIAKLKFPLACFEEVDYRATRGINKAKLVALQDEGWLTVNQNILITGPTGIGKSYLACAFGQRACRNGHSVYYFRWPRMLGDMHAARGDGTYLKYLNKLCRVNLLIIDDFGINSLNDTDRKDLLEVVEDRYTTGSTIITSQLPVKEWHDFIGDPTIADAVCDRLFHNAHSIEMKGGSMRKRQQ